MKYTYVILFGSTTFAFFFTLNMSWSKQNSMTGYRWLVSDLVSQDKDIKVVNVGPWLLDTRETFISFEVPESMRVSLALFGIPLDKRTEFRVWCSRNERDTHEWASLEEFLIKTYSGAVSTFDAFTRVFHLDVPNSVEELDTYVDKFKMYINRLGLSLDNKYVAMGFLIKLPSEFQAMVLSTATSDTRFNLDAIMAQAYTHFRAKEMVKPERMDVDALATRGNSRSPPSYSAFKAWVTRKEYDDRLAARTCLGCGGRHRWVACDKHPKGRKD